MEATDIFCTSVQIILKEDKNNVELGQGFSTPRMKQAMIKTKTDVDDFNRTVVHRVIIEFHHIVGHRSVLISLLIVLQG